MAKVVIFGTGEFAEVAHFYLTHDSEHEIVAFTSHEARIDREEVQGLPVFPFERLQESHPPADHEMFVAIAYSGVNAVRAKVYDEAKAKGYTLTTYISSKATYWGTPVGDNCFIFEDNTIQPFTTIGDDVILWSGNHIGHHSTIGDHCFLASHIVISGGVDIGPYTFMGVNATVRDHVRIGERCVIGAGALIMKDTEDGSVYAPRRTERFKKDSSEIKL